MGTAPERERESSVTSMKSEVISKIILSLRINEKEVIRHRIKKSVI